jgi:hypothetical protein
VPFRYRGLKDDVDFERIPWRNGRFDVTELEAALENSARMERLWAEWQKGDIHLFPPAAGEAALADDVGQGALQKRRMSPFSRIKHPECELSRVGSP